MARWKFESSSCYIASRTANSSSERVLHILCPTFSNWQWKRKILHFNERNCLV